MKALIGNQNMRHFLAIVLLFAALPLYAQERPKFDPVPAPPPEPGFNFDSAVDAPTVNIRRGDIQQIEERESSIDGKKNRHRHLALGNRVRITRGSGRWRAHTFASG